MKRIIQCTIFVLALFSCLSNAVFATDRTVPITFSVTSSGINRFIASQWTGTPHYWTDTYQGLTYTLLLNRPVITLTNSTIKIQLSLTVTSSVYNGTVTVTPTLSIPSTTISPTNIIAQYTDLHNQIIAISQFTDSRLRDVIEQKLSPINWVMYQGKILNESTTRITQDANIGWTGIPTLTFVIANDEVNITATPTITSSAPDYLVKWKRPDNRTFVYRVYSNNQITIDLTNNYLTYTVGGGVGYAVTSTLPATATFDATLQKYVAEVSFYLNNSVAYNLGSVYSRIKIKRANIETLWTFNFSTVGTSDWTTNYTTLDAIRGE